MARNRKRAKSVIFEKDFVYEMYFNLCVYSRISGRHVFLFSISKLEKSFLFYHSEKKLNIVRFKYAKTLDISNDCCCRTTDLR